MTDTSSNTVTQRVKETQTETITSPQTKSLLPKFILNGYQNDQNTFLGRLSHQLETTNPKYMFKSEKEIKDSLNLLKDFKHNPEKILSDPLNTSDKLWKAQTIARASTNSDTKEIIPLPFRLCGFVTFNMPVLVGLLWPNPSTATVFFWQWMNQNHNAAINFCNRNATNPTDPKLLVASYITACAGALSVPHYLNKFIKNHKTWTQDKKSTLLRFTPFPAVVIANSINIGFMRSKELVDGIEVTDSETGEVIGHSKAAAQRAIGYTALSRCIITAGVLALPPLIDNQVQPIVEKKFKLSPHLAKIKMSALVVTCAVCFYAVLPVSVAAFPQYMELPKEKLEKSLQEKTKGKYVIFNRGQ